MYFHLGNQGRLSQGAEFEQMDGFELAGEAVRQGGREGRRAGRQSVW